MISITKTNAPEGKFSEVEKLLKAAGCWEDSLSIDRLIVECHKCPECSTKKKRVNLKYKGFAIANHYIAYGFCEICDYAQYFWTEPPILRNYKAKLQNRIEAKRARA